MEGCQDAELVVSALPVGPCTGARGREDLIHWKSVLQVRLHSSCRAAGEPKVLQADEGEILVEDSIDCVSTAVVADGANVPGQARCARRWRGEGADRLQKPEPVGLARPGQA